MWLVLEPNFENHSSRIFSKKRIISPCLYIFPYLINRQLQHNVISIMINEVWDILETQKRGYHICLEVQRKFQEMILC